MKNLLFILSIAFINVVSAQSNNCERLVSFGNNTICLPFTSEMKECYNISSVKSWADLFKSNQEEEILGLYIARTNYLSGKMNDFKDGINYPYIKLYSTKSIENITASKEILDLVAPELAKSFENWTTSEFKPKTEQLFNNLSNKLEIDMSLDSPILIDEYEPSPSAKSLVVLMDFKIDGESFLIVSVLSIMSIEERLIFSAYYDEFKGSQALKEIKKASDYFVLKMIAVN